jgi:riboflavin synthase
MFTGIVEEMGAIISIDKTLAGTRMTILASAVMDDLKIGDSISVNGACLTVVSKTDRNFSVEVSPETLSVTTLGQFTAGSPLNLERAMKLNERIGGHLVAGHVDGVGTIRSRQQDGNAILLAIEAQPEILRHCILKGSITVDGISLTINHVTDRGFTVSIIPHTAKVTTLGLKQVGDQVNLESDLVGKYVERLLQERGQIPAKPTPVIDKEYLQKRGLL